jgi:hypothetical protein
MFHDAAIPVSKHYALPLYMKRGLVENTMSVRKLWSADFIRYITGKMLSPWLALWFNLLHTTAFREPYAVPVKPDELTSLHFE